TTLDVVVENENGNLSMIGIAINSLLKRDSKKDITEIEKFLNEVNEVAKKYFPVKVEGKIFEKEVGLYDRFRK
ncbi:MAG TPA: hypothetical protein PK771_13985, partial [Spirochaetota bacterium]|nr:hypothetical protein [Spirochaetota bacterium]